MRSLRLQFSASEPRIRRAECVDVSGLAADGQSVLTFTMKDVQAEAATPIILAENLSKVYAAGRIMVAAVRHVSFEVKRGEFVAIVGPSGSGKSTLFYLLGGLTRASEGKVVIDGVDFASLSDADRTRMRNTGSGLYFRNSTCCRHFRRWAISKLPTRSADARSRWIEPTWSI